MLTKALGNEDELVQALGLNPTTYMNSAGEVELRVNVTYAATSVRPNLFLDMARVKVNRLAPRPR